MMESLAIALCSAAFVVLLVWALMQGLRQRDDSETCGKCGAPANPPDSYWFAPNDLWNGVHGSPNGFRCIPCFTEDCQARGIAIGWRADRVGQIEGEMEVEPLGAVIHPMPPHRLVSREEIEWLRAFGASDETIRMAERALRRQERCAP